MIEDIKAPVRQLAAKWQNIKLPLVKMAKTTAERLVISDVFLPERRLEPVITMPRFRFEQQHYKLPVHYPARGQYRHRGDRRQFAPGLVLVAVVACFSLVIAVAASQTNNPPASISSVLKAASIDEPPVTIARKSPAAPTSATTPAAVAPAPVASPNPSMAARPAAATTPAVPVTTPIPPVTTPTEPSITPPTTEPTTPPSDPTPPVTEPTEPTEPVTTP